MAGEVLIPVKQVIFQYINRARLGRDAYRRLFPIAMSGVTELGTDVYMPAKTVKMTVEQNKTVKYPEDAMKIVQVGVLNDRGEMATLDCDNHMTSYEDLSWNRTSVNTDDSLVDFYSIYQQFFLNYYYMANVPMNLFGLPSGRVSNGRYKLDDRNRVIILDNHFSYDYLMVDYLPAPCDDDFTIPVTMAEALIAWLSWQDVIYVPNEGFRANISEKQMRRQEYYNQKHLARLRTKPLDLSAAGDIYRK